MRAWRAATVGLLVFAQEPGIAEEAVNEPHYRLSAAALACFVQNREVYKAASGEPVFLLADRCPPKRPPSLLDALPRRARQRRGKAVGGRGKLFELEAPGEDEKKGGD